MKLLKDIEIIEPYPAVYIKDIDSIIIADLHLGYEGIMAEQGTLIPKVQFKKEMQMLKGIISKKRARQIIIDGDVKHEFSETTYHEFKEVKDLFYFLKSVFDSVILIKGNHDNFIYSLTSKHTIELYDELLLKNFLFIHGHKLPKEFEKKKAKVVIIGHEHPAIALFDEIGAKEKMDCFLFGGMKNKKILVLPAFSYLAQGSEVNIIPREELLSPILKNFVNIDDLRVIGTSEETGSLDFSTLSKLRKV